MIVIEFGKFQFNGLKLERYEKYPWSTPEERKDFFGKLHEEKTNYSKERWIRFSEKEAKELIHVNMSKFYVFRLLGIIGIVMMFLSPGLLGTILLGAIGLGCLISGRIFKSMAIESWMHLQMDYMMAEMIFPKNFL